MSLETRVSALAVRSATEDKSIRTLLNGNALDNSALTTTAKANLVLAINEIAAAANAAAVINDASTGATEAWSAQKIAAEIATAVANLINSAPGTLDTLDEIAAALGDDPNFATTLTTELAARLRFDAAQTLTAAEMTQGQTNLGVVAASDIGDFDRDFVVLDFEANL